MADNPIDPTEEEEQNAQLFERTQDEIERQRIADLQNSYARVFVGKGGPDDVDAVMRDLATYCFGYDTSLQKPEMLAMLQVAEGRRQVFLRIMDFAKLSHDDLFRRYRARS